MNYKFINTEYIDSVSGGDSQILAEISELFREQVSEFNKEFNRLLEDKNYLNLGLLAHKAKSSVAIMGMSDLAAMLKTFELEAKENRNPGQYASYIERFRSETAEALKELDAYLGK
jgi:HPt (histidine-containing phosphotransfer) domain-containing protein